MGIHKNETLPDISYWLALEISKVNPIVDLDLTHKESLELDLLYQLLSIKAKQHWKQTHGVELSPVMINNAFFRAISILHERDLEFCRSRNAEETLWVKSLLKR
jgi:hypothetical protein